MYVAKLTSWTCGLTGRNSGSESKLSIDAWKCLQNKDKAVCAIIENMCTGFLSKSSILGEWITELKQNSVKMQLCVWLHNI